MGLVGRVGLTTWVITHNPKRPEDVRLIGCVIGRVIGLTIYTHSYKPPGTSREIPLSPLFAQAP